MSRHYPPALLFPNSLSLQIFSNRAYTLWESARERRRIGFGLQKLLPWIFRKAWLAGLIIAIRASSQFPIRHKGLSGMSRLRGVPCTERCLASIDRTQLG